MGPAFNGYGDWIYYHGSWVELNGCGGYNWNMYLIVDLTGADEDGPRPGLSLSFSTLNQGHTTIYYSVPRASDVSLKLYDMGGRLVMTLKNGHSEPGRYAALVQGLGQGTYIVRLTAGQEAKSMQMVVKR